MSSLLSGIAIGPDDKGYVYKPMGPDLWKCVKPADRWNVPDGHVLWLTRMEAPEKGWLAIHAWADLCYTAESRCQGTTSSVAGRTSRSRACTSGTCGTRSSGKMNDTESFFVETRLDTE